MHAPTSTVGPTTIAAALAAALATAALAAALAAAALAAALAATLAASTLSTPAATHHVPNVPARACLPRRQLGGEALPPWFFCTLRPDAVLRLLGWNVGQLGFEPR